MIFNELYFFEFLSYTSNQVVKKYLLGRENLLACTMQARAQLRARFCYLKMIINGKIMFFYQFLTKLAQYLARSVRQIFISSCSHDHLNDFCTKNE